MSLIKKTKKAAFALVRLPQQGNKHSYNTFCARQLSTAVGHVGQAGFPSNGNVAAQKASLLIKEHFLNVF